MPGSNRLPRFLSSRPDADHDTWVFASANTYLMVATSSLCISVISCPRLAIQLRAIKITVRQGKARATDLSKAFGCEDVIETRAYTQELVT